MEKIELYLDAPTLERTRRLAHDRGATIEQLLIQLIEQLDAADRSDAVLGSFSDEPDVLDHVIEDAMRARETQVLRHNGE
jgi:hypothetical protein